MRRLVRILSCAALLSGASLSAGEAMAQRVSPMTGGSFGRICSRPAGAQICDAYISGMADGGALSKINDTTHDDSGAPAGFCIPQTETGTAMRTKVVAWLREHKDAQARPVGEGVFTALHDAYPCSVPNGGKK
ncbi:hypothetical protein LOC54_04965 [Acetobacter sp. AN02]|uniref:Rap1a/Tai family immunity protein n=1 Tax=Acetobacter sp. AN02 TaxID=2894186 RepID=UPI002434439E|nr:Rap1a/Tai family immunity protein [Acetobacter sp. AN02]MDG6094469.1 hypothetical protein [Acetobacter sp. AN02]